VPGKPIVRWVNRTDSIVSPFEHTGIILQYVRLRTDSIILFYSGGKDSIVLLDILAKKFEKVHCVFMFFVENLRHQAPLIDFAKRYPNVIMHQYPHWELSEFFQNGIGTFHNIRQNLKTINQRDIEDNIKNITNIKWAAFGLKEKDSIKRLMMLRSFKFDAINEKSGQVHPLSKWSNKECYAYINQNKLIKPINYTPGSKSDGVTISGSVLYYLKNNYLDDYQKIIKLFPFAELNLFKYEKELLEKQSCKTPKIRSSNNKQGTNKKCTIQSSENREQSI